MSQNYKETLNLPRTEFPMKANLAAREPEMLRTWEETRLYQQMGCAMCHVAGGSAPALEGVFGSTVQLYGGQTVLADEGYIRESILNPLAKLVAGYAPIMPTFSRR